MKRVKKKTAPWLWRADFGPSRYGKVRNALAGPQDSETIELAGDGVLPRLYDDSSDAVETAVAPAADPHPRKYFQGVHIAAAAATVVLVVNLILVIIAITRADAKNRETSWTSAVVYTGSCSVSKRATIGLHLLINVLSTIVLGASNYCMQWLNAPTREEVDRAHSQGVWLDIGVPSVHNIWAASDKQRAVWFLLLISSTPVHLLYNSTLFSSTVTTQYAVMVAPSTFEPKDLLTNQNSFGDCMSSLMGMSKADLFTSLSNGSYDALTKEQCVDNFAVTYLSGRGPLIVLSNNLTAGNNSILYTGTGNQGAPEAGGITGAYYPYQWMCNSLPSGSPCAKSNVQAAMNNLTVTGARGSHPNWVMDVDNGGTRCFFDATDVFNLTSCQCDDGADTADYCTDVRTLNKFLVDQGPDTAQELEDFLMDETAWLNSTWAANVKFSLKGTNCPILYEGYFDANVRTESYSFDSCLSLKADQSCQLFFNLPLSLVVIGCNVIKVLCVVSVARLKKTEVLLTVGDAVSSFLNRPDPTTKGMCWMSRSEVVKGPHRWHRFLDDPLPPSRSINAEPLNPEPQRLPPKMLWMTVPSSLHWFVTLTLGMALIIATGVLLSQAFTNDGITLYGGSTNMAYLWSLGLGTVSPSTIIYSVNASAIGLVLIANLPQVLISICYFWYNGTITHMLCAAEYSRYGVQRKALRVSWPRGQQRSTFWLTIPYRYAVPLMVLWAVLHWLVSQSLFYVNIIAYDLSYDQTSYPVTSALGYSPISIILTMIVGGVLLLGLVVLGLIPLPSLMPVAAGCSVVISAACHPPPQDEDDHPALKPVMWGEIREEEDTTDADSRESGHCSFTSGDVVMPSQDRRYS
ncbi:hypothetical protein CNMCM5793_006127 [Aspergillus hiratsukae]|uniref:DUF6536 domain-containing protein n=1 Tax=Aspergillus hiratsukae TaxID=1194566 RepID=A0A8H6QL71_9EURO|nr:hypothetical protein CNMCM5793_006127 [Aspergillus hiratsukae]KAF7174227.1 hypothetical protein CNMCM6106_008362 [Aspergillus hiratsukae]